MLLDGASWAETPIVALEDGVAALLERQAAEGGFFEIAVADGESARVDLRATALACRALAAASRRASRADEERLRATLARTAERRPDMIAALDPARLDKADGATLGSLGWWVHPDGVRPAGE